MVRTIRAIFAALASNLRSSAIRWFERIVQGVVAAAALLLAGRIADANVGAAFAVKDLCWWLALAALPVCAVCYT